MLTLDAWEPTVDEGEDSNSGNRPPEFVGAERGTGQHGRPTPSSLDPWRMEGELDVAEPEKQTREGGEQWSGRNRGSPAAAVLGFLLGRNREREGGARAERERQQAESTRGGLMPQGEAPQSSDGGGPGRPAL